MVRLADADGVGRFLIVKDVKIFRARISGRKGVRKRGYVPTFAAGATIALGLNDPRVPKAIDPVRYPKKERLVAAPASKSLTAISNGGFD
jgi:hypothetical protein